MIEIWDDGRLQVSSDWSQRLRNAGLTTFDAIWKAGPLGTIVRDFRPLRVTSRIDLDSQPLTATSNEHSSKDSHPTAAGNSNSIYLKCHGSPSWRDYISAWGRLRPLNWGALGEWKAMFALKAFGIPTAHPVVYGSKGGRSLVASAAVIDRVDLSKAVGSGHVSRQRFLRLLEQTASIAQKMHQAGWHHQDFYLEHFLIRPEPDDSLPIILDLHRAQYQRNLPVRWRVKDLAQLNFSSRMISPTDRMRWFLRYCCSSKLDVAQKKLLQLVLSKTRSIESHTNRLVGGIDSAAIKHRQRYGHSIKSS